MADSETLVCPHGQLARQCEICDLERRLREAERERDEARVAHGAAMALRLNMMKRAESAERARGEALQTLRQVKNCLEHANTMKPSPICDTIWYSQTETLFDFIDSAIGAKGVK